MPIIESPLSTLSTSGGNLPRHPQREIAELLATAIVRARVKGVVAPEATHEGRDSAVCLAITAGQSVHVNPSYQEGVRQ